MSIKWRATFPKKRPDIGKSDIVLSTRLSNGGRQEFTGVIPTELAQKVMAMLIENTRPAKEAPNVE
jgi:hypothetical protein